MVEQQIRIMVVDDHAVVRGGLAKFRPTGAGGSRDDGRDLIAEWQQAWPTGKFVDAAAPFRALDANSPDKVFGLFKWLLKDYAATPTYQIEEASRRSLHEPSTKAETTSA